MLEPARAEHGSMLEHTRLEGPPGSRGSSMLGSSLARALPARVPHYLAAAPFASPHFLSPTATALYLLLLPPPLGRWVDVGGIGNGEIDYLYPKSPQALIPARRRPRHYAPRCVTYPGTCRYYILSLFITPCHRFQPLLFIVSSPGRFR